MCSKVRDPLWNKMCSRFRDPLLFQKKIDSFVTKIFTCIKIKIYILKNGGIVRLFIHTKLQ
jgi:hypothetical protein